MKETYLPSVKGTIGDWTYYVTIMNSADLVRYVKFAEEVCPNTDLDMMIQREISSRSTQIADYLNSQGQRFLGSLIVAAYDGEPQFLPISLQDSPLTNRIVDKVGILKFDGSEQYYVVDGQHRLAALKEVINTDPARYKTDEVSVIVICHKSDQEGMARARRLFTTVNRYAKKTSQTTNIVMDEDDGIALITRRIIREHDFFKLRIKILGKNKKGRPTLATSESMQSSDKMFLMAIGTFYKCNKYLLPSNLNDKFCRQQQLPDYDSLERGFIDIRDRWDQLINNTEFLRLLREKDRTIEDFRNEGGGHVLARPVGIASFAHALGEALDNGINPNILSKCVSDYHNLAEIPWTGLLWNSSSNKMLAGREREKIGWRVWRYLMGLPTDGEDVNAAWRAFVDPMNQNPDLNLPLPVNEV